MRKSSYRVAAGLAVIALLAAGCSSDNAAEDTAASEETVAVDPQLEIFTWWSSGGEAEGLAGTGCLHTLRRHRHAADWHSC